jgi:hypothetical protein
MVFRRWTGQLFQRKVPLLTGGAQYEVSGIAGFTKKIWLCPVTLFVLGNYPAYIYLKKNV